MLAAESDVAPATGAASAADAELTQLRCVRVHHLGSRLGSGRPCRHCGLWYLRFAFFRWIAAFAALRRGSVAHVTHEPIATLLPRVHMTRAARAHEARDASRETAEVALPRSRRGHEGTARGIPTPRMLMPHAREGAFLWPCSSDPRLWNICRLRDLDIGRSRFCQCGNPIGAT